jgi:tRNA(Ile)-lysidine synthase
MLADKIEMLLASKCLVGADELCLVGVSGGPDSICLLHVLHRLGHQLVALHVNHALRPEADQEAQVVQSFVNSLGVDFFSYHVDVPTYADQQSLSIEQAARQLRYECLFEQAKKSAATAVLVAHNADDQVETILMHLLRGSGLTGLRGMEYRMLPNPWSKHIPLVRPLISTWREEILAYLSQIQLAYISDQSNYDTMYFRNRLRHELLPALEKYNPRIRQNLLRMGQINKEDYSIIQQYVEKAWQAIWVRQGPGYVAFRLPGFHELPPAIQRYLLRQAIAYHLPSLRDIDFDSIERGVKFLCDGKPGGQVDLIAGLRLLKEGELFWLATWQADLPGSDFPSIFAGAGLVIDVPGQIQLNDGWVLQATQETNPDQAIQQSYDNEDSFQAWIDLEKLGQPLYIRRRKPGDRLQPLGMQGHSLKISDLMVNLKLPKRARASWPLVCSGEAVIWVPGLRQGHLGRLQSTSQEIIHLTLSRGSRA